MKNSVLTESFVCVCFHLLIEMRFSPIFLGKTSYFQFFACLMIMAESNIY